MTLRKIIIESIKIKERTLDIINEVGITNTAEIPHELVDKASEIFVEGFGDIFADVVYDIDKDKNFVKGFYQEV